MAVIVVSQGQHAASAQEFSPLSLYERMEDKLYSFGKYTLAPRIVPKRADLWSK